MKKRSLWAAIGSAALAAVIGCEDSGSGGGGDTSGAESAGEAPDGGTGAEDSGSAEGESDALDEDGGDEGEPDALDEDGGDAAEQEEGGGDCPARAGCSVTLCPSDDDQNTVQTALIGAISGDVVCLSAGTFSFQSELSLDVSDVVLRGAGIEDTILDFSGQVVGSNGIKLSGNRIIVEDFHVAETDGDGIRAQNVEGVAFRRVKVSWAAEGSEDNGAYGLYPVESSDILVQECIVSGASDAGIYVGQSERALVIDNEVFGNVAGVEIENTTDAEVRGNNIYDNTGGVLVFNLPGLPVQDGKRAKVHNNEIKGNNRENFAPEGNIVGKVPAGTGVLILASDANEISDNTIENNDSVGVAILSYEELIFGNHEDPLFDKFPEGNGVYANTFANNGGNPDGIATQIPVEKPFPPLAWDGCTDDGKDNADGALTNCFLDNGRASYVNFDLCNFFATIDTDATAVTCEHPKLPGVTIDWVDEVDR
jgi:parallel beta-helix repeat protein